MRLKNKSVSKPKVFMSAISGVDTVVFDSTETVIKFGGVADDKNGGGDMYPTDNGVFTVLQNGTYVFFATIWWNTHQIDGMTQYVKKNGVKVSQSKIMLFPGSSQMEQIVYSDYLVCSDSVVFYAYQTSGQAEFVGHPHTKISITQIA